MSDIQSEPQQSEVSDDLGISLEADAEIWKDLGAQIEAARNLVFEKKYEEATEACKALIAQESLPLGAAAKVALIFKSLGHEDVAEKIQKRVLKGIKSNLDRLKDPQTALFPAAAALFDLGEKEDAEKLVWKALQKAPDTQLVVVEAAALFVQFDLREHAYNVAKTYLENTSDAFNSAIHLSVVLSHLKYVEGAQMCLQIAEKNCKTKAERAKLDYFFASNGMPVADLDQHGMAVELFDKFAENYDTQLGILGNNGPSLIFTALQELNLPKKKTQRVLDAGCGTGLCAGFLREYAKELTGIDLSVKMLEVSREKGLYDFLARTDLSVPATFPEGKFDLIVCADVLVYFGELKTVLTNFHQILNPGGMLIVTVEDEGDETVKTGFKLYPSGRYKHSDTYIEKTVREVGFPKPKLFKHARLRNEFGAPVLGTVFAVQKPALVFN